MRLIDADALILANVDLENYCNVVDIALAVIKSVREAPTIDVENFVRYHMDEISRTIRYQLVEVDAHKPHCPNCGEKMEKDGETPTIDPESLRPQGEWISRFARHWKGRDECSRCGFHEKDHRDLSHYNYCPKCGARMKKDGDA